jgi:hypothetical protein
MAISESTISFKTASASVSSAITGIRFATATTAATTTTTATASTPATASAADAIPTNRYTTNATAPTETCLSGGVIQ